MVASHASRPVLARLLEAAVKLGLPVSMADWRDRDKGTAEVRFHYRCEGVVNTANSVKKTWQNLAQSRKIECRFADPVEASSNQPNEEAGDELTAEELTAMFGEDASVDGAKLQELAKLVDRYVQLETELDALGEVEKERNKELTSLRLEKLPAVMRAARILKQDMDSGHRVSLGTTAVGGWPKEENERKKAYKALAQLGSSDLVKQTITISFSPEEGVKADQVLKYLKRIKVPATVDRSVNTMTYRAWAKEMLADPKKAPEFLSLVNDLGIIVMDQATVKQLKKR